MIAFHGSHPRLPGLSDSVERDRAGREVRCRPSIGGAPRIRVVIAARGRIGPPPAVAARDRRQRESQQRLDVEESHHHGRGVTVRQVSVERPVYARDGGNRDGVVSYGDSVRA